MNLLVFLPIEHMINIILLTLGISYVITGSRIGYLIRFAFCALTNRKILKELWYLVRCPPCNSWWAGLAVSLLSKASLVQSVAMAFICCGITAVIQHALGGDGLAANEDFEELFGGAEEDV